MRGKEFWHLLLLHHHALPLRWKVAFSLIGLILGVELFFFFLPPIPSFSYFLEYFSRFLKIFLFYNFPLLVVFAIFPIILLGSGGQDVGGKTFALTLPGSRTNYFWARFYYGLLPFACTGLPILFLAMLLEGVSPTTESLVYSIPVSLTIPYALFLCAGSFFFYSLHFWLSWRLRSAVFAFFLSLLITFFALLPVLPLGILQNEERAFLSTAGYLLILTYLFIVLAWRGGGSPRYSTGGVMSPANRSMRTGNNLLPSLLLIFLPLFLVSCSALEAKREMASFKPESIPNPYEYSYYRWYMTYFFGYEEKSLKPDEKAQPKGKKPPRPAKPVTTGLFPEPPPSTPSPYQFQPELGNARAIPGTPLFSWDVPEKLIWGYHYSVSEGERLFTVLTPDGRTRILSLARFPLHSLGGSSSPERYLIYSNLSQNLMIFDGEGKLLKKETFCRWRLPVKKHGEFVFKRPRTWIPWEIPPPEVDFLPLPLRKGDPLRLLVSCPTEGSLAIFDETGQSLTHIHIRQPTLPPLFAYDWKAGEGFIAVPLLSDRVLIYDRFGNQTARLNLSGNYPHGFLQIQEMEISAAYEGNRRFWVLIIEPFVFIWDTGGRLLRSFLITAQNLTVAEVQPGLSLIGAYKTGRENTIDFFDLNGRRISSRRSGGSLWNLISRDLNFDGLKEFYLTGGGFRSILYFPLQAPQPDFFPPARWNPEGGFSVSQPIGHISIPFEANGLSLSSLSLLPAGKDSVFLCAEFQRGLGLDVYSDVIDRSECNFVQKNQRPLKTTYLPLKGPWGFLGPDLNGDGIRDILFLEKTDFGAGIEAKSPTGKPRRQWKATFDTLLYNPSRLETEDFLPLAGKWWYRLKLYPRSSNLERRTLYFLHDPVNTLMNLPISEEKVPKGVRAGSWNVVVLDGLDVRPFLMDAEGFVASSSGERWVPFSYSYNPSGQLLGALIGTLQSTWLFDSFGKVSLKIPDVVADDCTSSVIPDPWNARAVVWSCSTRLIEADKVPTPAQNLVLIVEKGGYGVGLYQVKSVSGASIPVTLTDLFGDEKPDLVGATLSRVSEKEWVVDLLHLPMPPMIHPHP